MTLTLDPERHRHGPKLLGHSDIDTTRQYLNPDKDLKRQAVNRLSLPNLKETQA